MNAFHTLALPYFLLALSAVDRSAHAPQALVVEAVDLRDLPRLVVAAQDGHPLAIADFERDEQGDRFDRVVSAVDVAARDRQASSEAREALASMATATHSPMNR